MGTWRRAVEGLTWVGIRRSPQASGPRSPGAVRLMFASGSRPPRAAGPVRCAGGRAHPVPGVDHGGRARRALGEGRHIRGGSALPEDADALYRRGRRRRSLRDAEPIIAQSARAGLAGRAVRALAVGFPERTRQQASTAPIPKRVLPMPRPLSGDGAALTDVQRLRLSPGTASSPFRARRSSDANHDDLSRQSGYRRQRGIRPWR